MLRNKIEKIMVENLNFSNFGGVDIVIKGFPRQIRVDYPLSSERVFRIRLEQLVPSPRQTILPD